MTTATITLTGFLLARIAEDEDRARRAAGVEGADFMLAALPLDVFDGLRPGFPNRVLAECAAKRAIIQLHSELSEDDDEYSGWRNLGLDTLRALASVYVDHPDYRDEWRPQN